MKLPVKNIAVIGCSGAIGRALIEQLSLIQKVTCLHAFSRTHPTHPLPGVTYCQIDYRDEESIACCAQLASRDMPLDRVIVATGILHEKALDPEKALRDMSQDKFLRLFEVNTILPALIAKHFLPHLNQETRSIFAALSARVGSISDNRLGGWYAYRASKAALNMVIKTCAIEMGRKNKNAIVVGLHPGTVDSPLSKPFQGNVPKEKLFTPEYSAKKLLEVLDKLTPEQSGRCFAWDRKEIDP